MSILDIFNRQSKRKKQAEELQFHLNQLQHELNNDRAYMDIMNLVMLTVQHQILPDIKNAIQEAFEKRYGLKDGWYLECLIDGTFSRIALCRHRSIYVTSSLGTIYETSKGEIVRYQFGEWTSAGNGSQKGETLTLASKWESYAVVFDLLAEWSDVYNSRNYLSPNEFLETKKDYISKLEKALSSCIVPIKERESKII